TFAGCMSRTIGIGPPLGSGVEGAIPLAVVGLNRRTNSFVMCGSSALGHGGTSATAMRCWHFAAPSITVPSIGYLNAIDSDFERRKNHRMLLVHAASESVEVVGQRHRWHAYSRRIVRL